MKFKITLLLLKCLALSSCRKYDNYSLFTITPHTKDQLNFLISLESSDYIDVVFWRKPQKVYISCDFLLNLRDVRPFMERTKHYGFTIQEDVQDIQRAFDDQIVDTNLTTEDFSWDHYSTVEDIYKWLYDIAEKYPEKVTIDVIGRSSEDRKILAVSIKNPHANKKVVVEGGIHGHEWVTVAFVTYLINELLHATGDLEQLYKKYVWHIVPIVNPDGYAYSFSNDRLWRKNTKIYNGTLAGVNLNRNFDFAFGKYDSSKDPKNQDYCGPSPFSESESKSLADFISFIKKGSFLMYYFSIHAYGQLIVIPFSDRINHLDNYPMMENYGKQAIVRIFNINGTKYHVGTTYDTMGKRISGSSADWVKKEIGVPYVFTIILRDSGKYGYALPANQIIPTCREALEGMIQLMTSRPKFLRSNLFEFSTAIRFKNYYNYTLLRALPTNDEHLGFLKNLTEIYDANMWHEPGLKNSPVDFVISPNDYDKFAGQAKSIGVEYSKVIDNIEDAFKMQSVKEYVRRNMQTFDWNNYYRVNDMYQWLKDLSQKYKGQMELFSIAKTAEGRDILCAKINLNGASTLGQTIIVEAGIHAREWVSSAFATYFLKEILTAGSSQDTILKHLALSYTWYFVPMLNPDGYEYTHATDRLWRKNRNPRGGVDINRNFDSAFGTVGISLDKNKETYCGEHAFSEPESIGMRDLVKKLGKSIKYYMAFHSYGQYMILPFAYSKDHVLNFDEVHAKGKVAYAAIKRKFNTEFKIGTAYDTVSYMTSGVSACWVKKAYNTPYVVVFELRDKGKYGFALPSSQIFPTCLEMMEGMKAFITPPVNQRLSITEDSSIDQAPSFILTLILNCLLWIIFRYD